MLLLMMGIWLANKVNDDKILELTCLQVQNCKELEKGYKACYIGQNCHAYTDDPYFVDSAISRELYRDIGFDTIHTMLYGH